VEEEQIKLVSASVETGYASKRKQPAFCVELLIPPNYLSNCQAEQWLKILDSLAVDVKQADLAFAKTTVQFINWLQISFLALLAAADISRFEPSAATMVKNNEGPFWRLKFPVIATEGFLDVYLTSLKLLMKEMESCLVGLKTPEESLAGVKGALNILKKNFVSSHNRYSLIFHAQQLGIPWRHIVGSIYQFGWGKHSRLLDSTHTDQTSILSFSMAKNKLWSKVVLQSHGINCPRGELVSNISDGLRKADAIGYPVVIKPNAGDGGVDVITSLEDDLELHSALHRCGGTMPKGLLIERYIDGIDIRIQIMHGKSLMAIERIPAAVEGDGLHSVNDLVSSENESRARGQSWKQINDENHAIGRWPIVLDSEADRWLKKQGMTRSSIPGKGVNVRLMGAANVSRGGKRRSLPLSKLHPDLLKLAEDAVRLLRLDIAAVDMLVKDLEKPASQANAYICEINSQPQMLQLHADILMGLVPHRGRIPTVLVALPSVTDDQWRLLDQLGNTNGILLGKSFLNQNKDRSEVTSDDFLKLKMSMRRQLINVEIDAFLLGIGGQVVPDQLEVDHLEVVIAPCTAAGKVQLDHRLRWAVDERTKFMGVPVDHDTDIVADDVWTEICTSVLQYIRGKKAEGNSDGA